MIQMTASTKPTVYLRSEPDQCCVLTITNSGSDAISFRGEVPSGNSETDDGIEISLPYGDTDADLCARSDALKIKLETETPGWKAEFVAIYAKPKSIVWRVSASKDTTLQPKDAISVKLGSVTGNGIAGTVEIGCMLHTASASTKFSTSWKKIMDPEITKLWTSVCGNGERTFLSPDVIASEESEDFQQMPYAFPPPPPPTPHPLVQIQVNWQTANAATCELSYNGQTSSVAAGSGSCIIKDIKTGTKITLTAYGEEKVGKVQKNVYA